MSDFTPKTLKNVGGEERRVTTQAEQVAAEFDGFAEKLPTAKTAGADQPKPTAKKTATKGTSARAQARAEGTAGNAGEKNPADVTPPKP